MEKKVNKKTMARKLVFSGLYATRITGGAIDLMALQKKVANTKDIDTG